MTHDETESEERRADDETKSEERRAEDEKLEKEIPNYPMEGWIEKSISKELQCGKCKQKRVSFAQAQTGRANEPMTTFCQCTICGHRWRFQ